ncbi:MAG: alpha/beta hydrolase [Patescibacteria group bacterium]
MELQIQCSGYAIVADWYEGADVNKILIVLPGYSSSKARQKVHAEAMVQDTGTCALAVDFSGHGNSPFELRDTRPAQHFLELIYVFDWLKEQHPNATISVSGSSYGGFLAVQLTKYREFANLIFRAPAIYKPDAFYDLWSVRIDNEQSYDKTLHEYRKDPKALAKHPLIRRASVFTGKTLVVVHENDGIVPRQTTDAYINAFDADSIMAKGFAHTIDANNLNVGQLQEYQDHIANWLNNTTVK